MILSPSGRMDSQSAAEFETALAAKISVTPSQSKDVVLDLSEVPYVSSAGLRVVLVVAKQVAQAKGHFSLACSNPEVLSIFKVSGLTKLLQIFDTPDSAVAALRPA